MVNNSIDQGFWTEREVENLPNQRPQHRKRKLDLISRRAKEPQNVAISSRSGVLKALFIHDMAGKN